MLEVTNVVNVDLFFTFCTLHKRLLYEKSILDLQFMFMLLDVERLRFCLEIPY